MAKAKAVDGDKLRAQILEGLRKAMDDAPHRLQGSTSKPGLFPGGAAGKALTTKALEEALVGEVPSPEPPKKGSRAKPDVFVRITAKGRELVLASDSPANAISTLRESLEAQARRLQAEIAGFQGRAGALQESVAMLKQDVQVQFAQYQQSLRSFQAVLDHFVKQGPSTVPPPAPSYVEKPNVADGWLEEVVRIVAEQKRRNSFERPTLPQVYELLRRTRPALTLGQFHDGLRKLQEQRRIRLTPYSQALATLPDAQNALYLDREVKYYVDLP